MSIYTDNSEKYWRERKKDVNYKRKHFKALFVICIIFVYIIINYEQKNKREKEIKSRTNETDIRKREDNYMQCELELRKKKQRECSDMCVNEIKSIPRPIMHHACLHGCHSSFLSGAIVGCREGTKEKAFREFGDQSYNFCSRHKNQEPRPDIFSTCRKYYRKGITEGYQIAKDEISSVITKLETSIF